MAKTPAKNPSWRIYALRHKGEYICTVEAPDEKAAIAKAIEEHDIPPSRQKRLMAQLVVR